MLRTWTLSLAGFVALTLFVVGCQSGSDSKSGAKGGKADEAKADGDHGHKAGQHGGTIIEIGRDNFHAEAVFGDKGAVRLFILGKDEAQVQEVDNQTLSAYAKADGGTQAAEIKLEPKPRPDDAKGKTSVFEGTLPAELHGKRVEVTVATIRIAGGRFRFAFKNFQEGDASHTAMPPAASSEKAKKLYLTPGGKYTAADIKANGSVTAREKFGDEMAEHDMNPKKGDKICPVTDTKANPKFTWIVDGKKYEFCCPPCVDEFVKWAKEKPEKVKEPAEYVKK